MRRTTIDVDIRLDPETEALLRAIQGIKEELRMNVELASPADFMPIPDGWQSRSPFIAREGRLNYYHFDLLAQALAKVERAHAQDLADVEAMLERGLVRSEEALAHYARIEPDLYRFPAIDHRALGRRVEEAFGAGSG